MKTKAINKKTGQIIDCKFYPDGDNLEDMAGESLDHDWELYLADDEINDAKSKLAKIYLLCLVLIGFLIYKSGS